MHRRFCLLMSLVLLMTCLNVSLTMAEDVQSAPLTRSSGALNGMVRVYLSTLGNLSQLDVTVSGSYIADGAQDVTLSHGESVSVLFSKATGEIVLRRGGTNISMGTEMVLRRRAVDGESGLRLAQARMPGNLYPGDLHLKAQAASGGYRLYPILHVYLEYYLHGVLPYEMGNTAPIEALKAQAVAARTYTLNKMNIRKGALYDVVDTTSDQVYYGNSDSTTNCTAAVDATRGIVVMNGNTLTGTYYTASNGGQTESARNVWGSAGYGYLAVKDDPFDRMNTAAIVRKATIYADNTASAQPEGWRSLMTAKATAALQAMGKSTAGLQVTQVHSITPHTPMFDPPSRLYTLLDVEVTVATNAGSYRLTLTLDIFGEVEAALGMSINSAKNELWSVETESGRFVLYARRFGHGVGMSQRGAMQMGTLGYTYDQILGFYYTDCTRVQHTFTHTVLSGPENDTVVNTEPPAEVTQGSSTATVSLAGVNDTLPVRYTASADGRVLTTVVNGGLVTVLARGDQWTLIRLGQVVGYVPSGALRFGSNAPTSSTQKPTDVRKWATVHCNGSLNLRAAASYDGRVLASIPDGAVLCVFDVQGAWANVQYGAQAGWASTDFLVLADAFPGQVQSSATAYVNIPSGTGTVNLRARPSTSAALLGSISHGSAVTVLVSDGSWCQVQSAAGEGYVMARYLSFDKPADTKPPQADQPSLGDGESEAIVRTASGTLNLREAPDTSARVLMALPRGESIVVTLRGSEWCMVRYGDLRGYVMTRYLYFPADDAADVPAAYAVVNTASGSLNLRSQASTGSSVVRQIPRGARIGILEKGESWCRAVYDGSTGYVMTTYLRFEGQQEEVGRTGSAVVQTTSGSLNLREAPSAEARVLLGIPRGSAVSVSANSGGWAKTSYRGVSGYVMSRYLNFDAPAQEQPPTAATAVVSTSGGWLNLREAADANSRVLLSMPNGTEVALLDYGAEWSQVRHQGTTGFVMTRYLRLSAAQPEGERAVVNTSAGGLNLRETASGDARVLMSIPRGAEVAVLERGGEWSRVRYGQLTGYVMSRYLRFDSASAWVRTPSGALNLRETASLDARVMGMIPRGAEVAVLERGDEWCRIRYEGGEGYVLSRYLSDNPID